MQKEDEFFVAEASESESSSTNLEVVVDKQGVARNEEDSKIQTDSHNVFDFDLDDLTDKPWCKPGADITDYFNYGFNEQTWKDYCAMQKRLNPNYSKNTKWDDKYAQNKRNQDNQVSESRDYREVPRKSFKNRYDREQYKSRHDYERRYGRR